jgi:Rrf2 family protein
LTLPEVAAAEGLSVPYAAKLLSVLRQANMLESVRGRAGGYRLARPAASIGLGSLLLVLGEPLFDEPTYCERHAGTADGVNNCVHQGDCSLRALWGTLEQWIRGTLDQISVADLIRTEGNITELVRERLAHPVFQPQLVTLSPLNLTAAGPFAPARQVVEAALVPGLATGAEAE